MAVNELSPRTKLVYIAIIPWQPSESLIYLLLIVKVKVMHSVPRNKTDQNLKVEKKLKTVQGNGYSCTQTEQSSSS